MRKILVRIIIGILISIPLLFMGLYIASPFLFALWAREFDRQQPLRDERFRIPENAVYLTPAYEWLSHHHDERAFEILFENSETEKIDFQLFFSGWGEGFYHYYVWIEGLDEGSVQLRAFEYNTNTPLRMKYTDIPISEYHFEMKRYGPRRFLISTNFHTTLRFYLARFELWHIDENNNDQLLLTKIYRVSGFID